MSATSVSDDPSLLRSLQQLCHSKLAFIAWRDGGITFETQLASFLHCPAAPASEARAEELAGPDPAVMERVRSLCSTSVDPSTGLPSERITVMDDDETLYDFAVEVRTSSIPNAGHGAFLTYLGARVLRPEASARSARLLRGCYVDEDSAGSAIIPTRNTATARTPDGRMMKVTVTGENLHYNDNYRCVLCFVFFLLLLFGKDIYLGMRTDAFFARRNNPVCSEVLFRVFF